MQTQFAVSRSTRPCYDKLDHIARDASSEFLQAMESKLQKVKEAALEGGEECVVAISSVDNNSIDEVDPKVRCEGSAG